MKDLLTYIVQGITGNADIKVTEEEAQSHVNLLIDAPEDTVGILIGKQGRTIKMIRNLLRVRATLEKKGVSVEISEPKS